MSYLFEKLDLWLKDTRDDSMKDAEIAGAI